MLEQSADELRYNLTVLSSAQRASLANDTRMNMAILQNLLQMANAYGQPEHAKQLQQPFETYYSMMER